MRLFLALSFGKQSLNRLAELRDELRDASKRGNFTATENLHLTLVFIGECNAAQLHAAKAATDAAVFEPLDITIDRVGRFQRPGGDIWWAGVRETAELIDLQKFLTARLNGSGFNADTRKYNPHITLGREVVTDMAPRGVKPFGETVTRVELMKSERVSGRMMYTPVHVKSV